MAIPMVNAVVQRSQDFSQIRHNEVQKPMVDQSNIQINVQKEVDAKINQVNKYDNTEKKEDKYDAKEQGNGSYSGSNQRQKKREKREDDEDEGSVLIKSMNSHFDTKI